MSIVGAGNLNLQVNSSSSVNLVGETTVYEDVAVSYVISDYSAYSTYTVSINNGTVSRTGSTITVTPANAGTAVLTVTKDGTASTLILMY